VAIGWKAYLVEYLLKAQRLQKGNPDAQLQRTLAPLGRWGAGGSRRKVPGCDAQEACVAGSARLRH
jgi:hypothetical protein